MVKMIQHGTPPDPFFDQNELLYRRIEPGQTYEVEGKLKVSPLAVKMTGCSFHRSKYCSSARDVIIVDLQPAATGAAALRIGDIPGPFAPPPENKGAKVHELYVEHTPCMCEDPPLDLYPHSELFVKRHGQNDKVTYWPENARLRKQIRDDIAEQMDVKIRPE